MEKKIGGERKFVLQVLPWIIGAAAMGVYLLTLNPWVSFFNATSIARLSGWQWHAEVARPVEFLLTYPLRWLPQRLIPLALNLFTALCGAAAIGQLARCVALLPFDRTQEQRLRERSPNSLLSVPLAWIPPIVAAAACGLQLTFWDVATTGSPLMLNLLLFSYVVRSLLEYRNDGRESRLPRAALVFGMGMANDIGITGFFPLFVLSLLWLRGLSFFNFRFLIRTLLYGLIGLSLFLLLPFLASRSEIQPIDFWLLLKANSLAYKDLWVVFPKKTLFILASTTVLPAFLLFIRWAYGFGDNSQLGAALTTFIFHVVHAMFLVVCLWTVLDSPLSPRERGLGFAFLPFYYLCTLSIGYFCGYFLLVFKRVPSERKSGLMQSLHWLATGVVVLLLVAVPAGLVIKNLNLIRISNGSVLKNFARQMVDDLPENSVVLSDDFYRLIFARSWLTLNGREKGFIPLETRALTLPGYHRYLQKIYGARWPEEIVTNRETLYRSFEVNGLLHKLDETNDLYYLHPSFGYYFEHFYTEPHGLVYRLKPYGTNMLLPPPLTPEVVRHNEDFWAQITPETLTFISGITKAPTPEQTKDLRQRVMEKLKLPIKPSPVALALGAYYSRSLNYWGVEMQKLNELKQAGDHFQMALDLNPGNVVAQANLLCNTQLLAGVMPQLKPSSSIEDLFGKFRSWDEVMTLNGPYDEPSFCYAASYRFARTRLFRQSAQAADRLRYFAPTNFAAQILLARFSLAKRMPDLALTYAGEIRSNLNRFNPTSTNLLELAALEATAHLLRQETNQGVEILETMAETGTNNATALAAIFGIYSSYGLYTNALTILDRQLTMDPENVSALVNKGYIYAKLRAYDKAIEPLTEALTIQTNNPRAMFNRAIAYLCNNDLAEAQADYERLQAMYPRAYQVYFGLAQVALQRKDTNAAIQNYEAYLTNAPPNAPETKIVESRLRELKGEKEPEAGKTN